MGTESRHHVAAKLSVSILALLMVLAACSSSVSEQEWERRWEALLQEIPTLETVLGAEEETLREVCTEALSALRTRAEGLQETPDTDLESAAFAYITFAEGVFFECPLHSGEHPGWVEGYSEMDHLRAAVMALLHD